MHAPRIELTGFDAEDVPNLKAKGLIGEIIGWKLRLFLPMSEDGPRILGKLLHSHPVIANASRVRVNASARPSAREEEGGRERDEAAARRAKRQRLSSPRRQPNARRNP